ncbi:SDR family oxidoreductase [Pollutibacter soli]|uniref:SDR family NAD(P)-dependent oxidoreductase n=1 Tax=Pollutibacter soli TaxID=3034157 RepID=UPI00301400D8
MERLKQYVLITGGTSGIGLELARIFAQNGYNLVIVARDEIDLQQTRETLSGYGVEVETIAKDLFDNDQAFEVYEEVKARNITIDILVNNAGQGQYGEFKDTDIWRELSIIQLNISALVILTKQFLFEMLERGSGKILNTSSIASKAPGPYQSVYHGTKAFVQSFTEALRNEVKDRGIVVTALLPGATDTDFFNKADMLDSKIVQEGKLDDPAKVARDGYHALMRGDDMVVSGFRNKINVAMSNILPDEFVANNMSDKQEPVNKKTGKK